MMVCRRPSTSSRDQLIRMEFQAADGSPSRVGKPCRARAAPCPRAGELDEERIHSTAPHALGPPQGGQRSRPADAESSDLGVRGAAPSVERSGAAASTWGYVRRTWVFGATWTGPMLGGVERGERNPTLRVIVQDTLLEHCPVSVAEIPLDGMLGLLCAAALGSGHLDQVRPDAGTATFHDAHELGHFALPKRLGVSEACLNPTAEEHRLTRLHTFLPKLLCGDDSG